MNNEQDFWINPFQIKSKIIKNPPKLLSLEECEQFAKENPGKIAEIQRKMRTECHIPTSIPISIRINEYKSLEHALSFLQFNKFGSPLFTKWDKHKSWNYHEDSLYDLILLCKIIRTIQFNANQFRSKGLSLIYNRKILWEKYKWEVSYKESCLKISAGIDIGSHEMYTLEDKCRMIASQLDSQLQNFLREFKHHEGVDGGFEKFCKNKLIRLCPIN